MTAKTRAEQTPSMIRLRNFIIRLEGIPLLDCSIELYLILISLAHRQLNIFCPFLPMAERTIERVPVNTIANNFAYRSGRYSS